MSVQHTAGTIATESSKLLEVTGIAPGWLPDETLYSLCSRFHRLSCNALSSDTTRLLFGHPRFGVTHDLPTNLGALFARSGGHWGSAREIALSRTILPFHLRLKSDALAEEVLDSTLNPGLSHTKFRLGLLTSRFRAHHPLKACRICMAEDKKQHGISFWHLTHQIPGAWVCLKHQTLLEEATVKSNGVRRFEWLLPDDTDFIPAGPWENADFALDELLKFAHLAVSFAASQRTGFDPGLIARTYEEQFVRMGNPDRRQKPDWAQMSISYLEAITPLRRLRELEALPDNVTSAKAELLRMARPPRSGTHALRHLALIYWLFGSWSGFLRAYDSHPNENVASAQEESEDDPNSTPAEQPPIKKRLIHLVSVDGMSASGAAKQVGVDTTTAMAWLAQQGFATHRRPKRLKAEARLAAINALLGGADKHEVAQTHSLSVATITTLLRTEPGLHQHWGDARFQRLCELHRSDWTLVLANAAGAGVKHARTLAPACYAWLYRNDRQWLKETNAQVPRVVTGNNSQVDWQARDGALVAKVSEAISKLADQGEHPPLRRTRIVQMLPELKAKLDVLHRYPKTFAVLNSATKPPPLQSDLFD